MAQTSVNIRMDEATKKAFDMFCNEIGISVSSAFNMFAKTVIREHRIPFELKTDIPNAETIAAIKEVEDMKAHPEKYKKYNSFEEIMAELNTEEDEVEDIA